MPDSTQSPAPPQAGFSALRIATVAGIPIRLHFTFLLFLLWVGLAGPHGAGGLSILYVLAVFLCVVLHELGHSVVALRYGIPVLDITLYPIGGVARIEKRPTAKQELAIAVAGPAVNVVIALLLWGVLAALKPSLTLASLQGAAQTVPVFLTKVLLANVMLVLFNLIPAFPMDGGRVLRAVLSLNMPPARATNIASSIGQSLAIIAGIYAIFHSNWFLMFIAFFIYLGAGQEAFAYRQAALGEGVKVRDAMMTDVRTLTVGSTLKEAADLLLDTSQQDFPVVHGDQVQGLLTRDGLLRGLSGQGPSGYVAGAMFRQFASVGPDEDLGETLPLLQASSGPLLVLDPAQEGRLLGMITGENVQEYFAVKQIVAARTGANKNERI
jgi:Zn-dependent protease/predicted transcriptional regulator